MVLSHFWKRWRAEYLLELRNAHSRAKRATGSSLVSVGDLVLVHDEAHPRSRWKMSKVERILTSKDGQSRGAEVRVQKKRIKGNQTSEKTTTVVLKLAKSKYLNCKNHHHKVR